MPQSRPPFPAEFRTEAVRLYKESGKSLKQVAEDLGISSNSLRTWSRRKDIDAGVRPGLTTEEREELRSLRREVRILREERDILKKAAAKSLQQQVASGHLVL
jgi:transposase